MDNLDEYRVVPRDLSVAIPQSTRANEPELFAMYLRMATNGVSLSKACETAPFAVRSVVTWVEKYPAWMVGIQDYALAEATKYKLTLARRLSGARLDAELQIERLVLDSLLDIVRSTIAEATGGNVPAVRLVREWAREGFGLLGEDQIAHVDAEAKIRPLSYDPTQPLTRADVRSPPGTTVTLTVETPEVPLEVIATEVPHGTTA